MRCTLIRNHSTRVQQNLSQPCYRAPMFKLRVWVDDCLHILGVPQGANLRQALLDACLTPYAPLTQKLNCGGNGLCATCGVWLKRVNRSQPIGTTASASTLVIRASPAKSLCKPI